MLRQVLLLLIAIITSVNLQAGGKPEDIEALRNVLSPVSSMSAEFSQVIEDANGYQLQESQGTLVVSQPGKIRWISQRPMEQWVISDGETLWVFDPDLEQVTVQPFNQDLAQTPAILFSGDLEKLDGAYYVTYEQKDGRNLFYLSPEGEGSLFNTVILTFDDEMPVSMELVDNLDQHTVISFSSVQVNIPVTADQFVFKIPEGVDVINNVF